jgi:histidine triad (HIT) family protein
MMKKDCVFCKIARKEILAKAVFEDDTILAFEDMNPQAPAHVIIIPKNHIDKVSDLTEKEAGLIGRLVLAAKEIARKAGIADSGYRIVANCNKDGGQAVFHLHLHLLGGRAMTWPPG